ncbi:DUF481 domain-containing protein [Aeromonas allosaccharophila]|uniref:DUF481 domain-containing protein n=1 Tax=Aeromonas allosaccharophila TaxID=656 RepID=A0AAX3NQX5_9GAMM|nr:DUF481 domain-containing protein [Aeromonas allosaccharophila]WED75277.1 DUF481 domain-containing protein [Aeromonas allosaccharophila]
MKYLPLMLMVFCHPMWAKDILWMNNGDRLTGTIEEIGDKSVRIALPYTGVVTVKRDAIKRWRLEKQDKPKATAKGGITLFKNEQDERRAWLWTGSGDLNIKLKHKDKHTNNVNFKGKTELANLDWRYSFSGEYSYETSDSVTDNHDYKLNPTLDYFFDQHWFVRNSLDADYDMLADNYLKLNFGSGPGYRVWNDKHRRLELIAQGGIQRAYFRSDSQPGLALFDSRIISYPIGSLGWDYRQPLAFWQQRFELFSKGTYLKYLSQSSPYLTLDQDITGSIGLRYYFNDHLRLSWSSEMEWQNGALHYPGVDAEISESEWRHLLSLGASF